MKNEPYKTEYWFSARRQAYIEHTVSARLFEKGLLDKDTEKAEKLKKQTCQHIYNIIEDLYQRGQLEGKQDLNAYLEGLVELHLRKFVEETLKKEIRKTARWMLNNAGLGNEHLVDEAYQCVRTGVQSVYENKFEACKDPNGRRGYLAKVIKNQLNNFINNEKAGGGKGYRKIISPEDMEVEKLEQYLEKNKVVNIPYGNKETLIVFFKSFQNRVQQGEVKEKGRYLREVERLEKSPDDDISQGSWVDRPRTSYPLPEETVMKEQMHSILCESIMPECIAAAGNQVLKKRMECIYTYFFIHGYNQNQIAQKLGVGENIVSGQLSKFHRCVERKSIKKGLREANAIIPGSHKEIIKRLAGIGRNSYHSDRMEKMQFIDAMSYALFCHFNRLDLAHVTDEFYQWKSNRKLKAWLQFFNDINGLEVSQYYLEQDCLSRYMTYLFDHKKGDIESFKSYQDGESL